MEKYVYLLLLVIILSTSVSAINIRGGDILLVRPDSPYIDHDYVPAEYLSVEDLIFYTCIEEKGIPVKSSIICLDDNSFEDVEVVRWLDDDNCYMGSYNLDQKDCRKILIQSEYIKDEEVVTLDREVKINRLSSIIDLVTRNQYSDGGWRDSVQTASGIWVLSNYPEIFDDELSQAIEWLKLARNNDEKCWPKKDCSVQTTAKILAYLTQAGLNETHRIVHDGHVYLKNQHNFFLEDDEWLLNIVPLEAGNTSCVISYSESLLNQDNFTMDEDEYSMYNLTPVENEELLVICDRNFRANLTANNNDLVFLYEGDNMSYQVPFNCWSVDSKWGDCDLATTLFATMTNISETHREIALEYLESELRQERGGEMSIGSGENVSLAALYSALVDNTNVTGWLRYKQNNEGSWGNGTSADLVIPTGYALIGLLTSGFNRTDEVIEDAEKWVNDIELEFTLNITQDYVAWNDTEKNALAFIVLRNNARPVLKSQPRVLFIDKQFTDVEIFNPTTFDFDDVSFEFSDNLKDILTIEEDDFIPSYSYVKQTITKSGGETGSVYGYLYVINYDNELGKIPIMMVNSPKIEIKSSADLIVFGSSAKHQFDVIKTGHRFSCTLEWDFDDISSKSEHVVDGGMLSVELSFPSPERVERTYSAQFQCASGDYVFDIDVPVKVSRYAAFPFSLEPTELFINRTGQTGYVVIENKLDETLDLELKFMKNSDYFELSRTSLAIDPNMVKNVNHLQQCTRWSESDSCKCH